ncbi:PepSY domain-containing protein [Streptomyces sp. NPDC054956]
MKRTLYVSSAAAAAVLLVGGPVAAAAASGAYTPSSDAASAPLRADVDAEGAVKAALEHHPGVIASLDKDGPVWHVNVVGKDGVDTELLVNAASGTVFVENDDENDDDSKENAAIVAAEVTAQQAMKAALAAHPGKVWSVQWDNDDKARYWDVEIKAGGKTQNVHVDPSSGKATVSPSDNDNDNDENENENDDNG